MAPLGGLARSQCSGGVVSIAEWFPVGQDHFDLALYQQGLRRQAPLA
jgi:hypothetical protein